MHHRPSPLYRALALAALLGGASPLALAAEDVELHIAPRSLDSALTQFADQAGLHLLFNSEDVQGLNSPGLDGRYSREEALDKLLSGSGMRWSFSDERTVLLQREKAAGGEPLSMAPTQISVAARTPTDISSIPGTVWVVDQAQLREQLDTGVSLKEAVGKLVPGLDLAPEGRTNYGQNMRGRNVLVMIDGVSQNSSRGLSRQFDSISPFNVERIEVLSGASAIYGGGATGGIVNIITRSAAQTGTSRAVPTPGAHRTSSTDGP